MKGEHLVSEEIRLPKGAHDLEIRGVDAVLKAAPNFDGRAMLSCTDCRDVRISGFRIEGNRGVLSRPHGLPPSDKTFAQTVRRHGVLIEASTGVAIDHVQFTGIPGMAILVTRSQDVRIEDNRIEDSGSRKQNGRNNTTGGVLLEDGTSNFLVQRNVFRNVLGNGVWTHARYESPRNARGRIIANEFDAIARDAIQVGHATRVRVEHNRGTKIGYPVDAVDMEGGGTPVAIDTAGNVDTSRYAFNNFSEINGKCIDLDGFHDGEVDSNRCVNRGAAGDYPFGHFAIVMNNTNPEMQSIGIRITRNAIDGTKFGGIFVIGSGHVIAHNWLRNLNLAACDGTNANYGCLSFPGEPHLLRSGIYFGKGAERPAPASGNTVIDNHISGRKLQCIGAAPSVLLSEQRIGYNTCQEQ